MQGRRLLLLILPALLAASVMAWGVFVKGWFFDSDEWGTVGEWIAGLGALAAAGVALFTAREAAVGAQRATEALALELKPDISARFAFEIEENHRCFNVTLDVTVHAAKDVEVRVIAEDGSVITKDRRALLDSASPFVVRLGTKVPLTESELEKFAALKSGVFAPLDSDDMPINELVAQNTASVRAVDVTFSDERSLMRWKRRFVPRSTLGVQFHLEREGPDVMST
jgi:hypothetical protein